MSKLRYTKKRIRKYGTFDEKNFIRHNKRDIVEKIRELIRNEKYQLVEYSINNFIEKYGEDCYLLHEKARYKAATNNIEEAKKIYKLIIDADSENKYYSLYELGKLESETGNFNLALSYYEMILSSNHKEKCHALLETAKVLNLIGENKKAEEYLNIIIDNNMENKYRAMENLAIVLMDIGNLKLAEYYIEETKNHVEDANYKYLKGCLEIKRRNYIEGKKYFEDILKNEPYFKTKATLTLANVEYDLENYEKAIEILKTIKEDTGFYYYEANKKIAHCYIKLKMFEEAEEQIHLLDKEDNRYIIEQSFLYGRLYQIKGDYISALSYYQNVSIDSNILYLDSLHHRICILIKLQKYEDAYKLIDELEKNDNNNRYTERINSMKIFLNRELNLGLNLKVKRYTDMLINYYNKDLVLEHIEKHKYEDDNNVRHTIFSDDIDINELYNHVINNINEDNFYYSDFMDVYIIPYKSVGIDNGEIINFVKAVTLPNSKDIITIFPFNKLPSIKKAKVKELSRIEKFNLKYGIK